LWATGIYFFLPFSKLISPANVLKTLSLASKDWVIPAKPKPGRKPKKDLVSAPVQQSDVMIFQPD
jgi:hypothetical protein